MIKLLLLLCCLATSLSAATQINGFTTNSPGAPIDAAGSLISNAAYDGDGALLSGVSAKSLSLDQGVTPVVIIQYNVVMVSTNLEIQGDWIKFLNYKFAHATGSKSQSQFVGINSGLNASGYPNVSFGPSALYALTSGTFNTAFGNHTLDEITDGSFNTAFGTHALNRLTNGWYNSALGEGVLEYLHQGTNCVGVGMYAGVQQMAGRDDTWIGAYSGSGALGTNYRATALGANAGNGLIASEDNLILGAYAGSTDDLANQTTNGSQVVFLGNYAGAASPRQLTNSVAIGFQAKVAANNQAAFGELLSVGIGTNNPQTKLHVRGIPTEPALAIDNGQMANPPASSLTGLVVRVNGVDYVIPLYQP